MTNDDREESRGFLKRRPFLYEIPENRVNDILKAYEKSDEFFFRRREKKKKKLF